jgi:hypothetical protein
MQSLLLSLQSLFNILKAFLKWKTVLFTVPYQFPENNFIAQITISQALIRYKLITK